MRSLARSLPALGILGFAIFASPFADAATISGTVTGPDGAPFRGAFVQARHAGLKMTVSVLSDNQGHFFAENLPAGEYRLQVRAVGYKTNPKSGINLSADQNATYDFALAPTMIRWTEISQLQGYQLLPNEKGKETLFQNCMSCHGFQSKMAAVVRDEDGWRDRVSFMREAMRSSLADRNGFNDQQADEVVHYLTTVFGEQSDLPKSPADLPSYKDTVFQPTDEALKIVYVDFDMPGPNRFPWTSNGDKDGLRWTPEYGQANKVMRLNPQTGEMTEFPVPNMGPALIHSAVPAPDGSVWMTEAGSKKIARWDPKTQKIVEWQDDWRKHTIRLAPDGRVWSTGGLSVFDPKTEKFTHIPEVPTAYGIAMDPQNNIWVTEMTKTGFLDKIDPNTLKVTKYIPPSRDRPRRVQVDSDGTVWFCVFEDGKIDRFDPKTETFKEFPLPNAKSHPYALGIATDRSLWYSSESRDVIGRLDPDSGKVIEYPMPYADNGMRDFFLDKDGHMWYGSPPNNRVGYFYLSTRQRNAAN
jgi:streptogramin lyase/cytochrome c5